MEKIKCICVLREITCAMAQVEAELQRLYNVSLIEAMTLCCIGKDKVGVSFVKEQIGLSPSHTSKVINVLDSKGYVHRTMGETDRRNMFLTLTPQAIEVLQALKGASFTIPEVLQPLFEAKENSTE